MRGYPFNVFFLSQYDSVHGQFDGTVKVEEGKLVVNGKSIKVSNELDPSKIQWGDSGADFVLESTGEWAFGILI